MAMLCPLLLRQFLFIWFSSRYRITSFFYDWLDPKNFIQKTYRPKCCWERKKKLLDEGARSPRNGHTSYPIICILYKAENHLQLLQNSFCVSFAPPEFPHIFLSHCHTWVCVCVCECFACLAEPLWTMLLYKNWFIIWINIIDYYCQENSLSSKSSSSSCIQLLFSLPSLTADTSLRIQVTFLQYTSKISIRSVYREEKTDNNQQIQTPATRHPDYERYPTFTNYHERLDPVRWLRKGPWNCQHQIPDKKVRL